MSVLRKQINKSLNSLPEDKLQIIYNHIKAIELSTPVTRRYNVLLEWNDDDDAGFTVTVPSLPGCISQGDTRDEALDNIKEAIECYLQANVIYGENIPDSDKYLGINWVEVTV
ncbi:type II toxin-antitoxin system HicB family antitoxin [Desulfoscipio geothermicus]|uniref:Predicted nuclease of the RNAse H fold, HicB family n=1 Tax=Desulfoscipio geothermicus DSM 3669 TaxID=1121426 RepID=A0A1I6E4A9_9FIRM|nr:type II toxin-antitoxin system HicB family antitoxin [Desulfoscipio geothermicus]SFR12382.1 Predicted nuclease of the RNAse H fold, HicB family [Desulfoscipio geothermicus DSM 3669]